MESFRLILMAILFVSVIPSAAADESQKLEESVCGSIIEPLMFYLWSGMAGGPNPDAASGFPNAEPLEYKTKDRRLLKGYKLKSTQPDGTVVGSMLYFQGNATLADQMFSDLASFSAAGIEVFIFDYRGYGDSEGRPRLKAIVSDYKEIFESVVAATPEKHFLYGVSFGGIILMNVIGKGIVYDRAVIDSPPSRISTDGCQEKYDPVVNFPENGSRLLFVAGEKDKTISIKKQKELLELAKARGSRVEIRPDFAHHTEDSGNVKQARIELIKSFLVGI